MFNKCILKQKKKKNYKLIARCLSLIPLPVFNLEAKCCVADTPPFLFKSDLHGTYVEDPSNLFSCWIYIGETNLLFKRKKTAR